MKLSLLLEQTGQSWTITPSREYVVGSGKDCDIYLPNNNFVSTHHLKLSFNQQSNTWHVLDLGSSHGTFVNNQPITDYPIQIQTRIAMAGGIVLVATPEVLPGTTQPAYTSPPRIYSSPPQPTYPPPFQQPVGGNPSYSLQMLTWKEYVEQQVKLSSNFFTRIATRFSLVTGFRNTPWVRGFEGYNNGAGNNFNAFDGYILPDFQESAETVAIAIEEKIGQMKQYEDTDCYLTRLTDAHIVDSGKQSFLGIELFPIFRGRWPRADYRKFCVASYHRVRTYLLVENYGSDLFVSWITRFEPQPTIIPMILLFILACFLTFLLLLQSISPVPLVQILMIIMPLFIWCEIYLMVPAIMQSIGILPKKANAILVMVLLILVTLIVFSVISVFAFSIVYGN
ncbi:MAG: hypothetical protein C6Y22_01810 [Hapalosiphonaceae cyanobacterium JJU2]|nr:MAG: hypothetical protein C6Y22_01810 [Hapalosiphonaceae cyanobacterium JJU2]